MTIIVDVRDCVVCSDGTVLLPCGPRGIHQKPVVGGPFEIIAIVDGKELPVDGGDAYLRAFLRQALRDIEGTDKKEKR